MKFKIKREILISILSEYSNMLKDNPIKPVLSGLKIIAKKDKVTFIGTNIEVDLIKEISTPVEIPGTIVLKIGLVLEYIKLLDEEILEFSLEDKFIHVHEARFAIMDEENYPEINKKESRNLLKINGKYLTNLLDRTRFAGVKATDGNTQMECVRALFKPNELNLVATDSFRLLFLRDKTPCIESREISIPLESVSLLCKLLKDVDEEVTLGYNEGDFIVNWNESYFSTKTIALEYPDFKTILRMSAYDKTMEFNKDELKLALKRVTTVAKNSLEIRHGAIFDFKGKKLEISAYSGKAKIKQKVNMLKDGDDLRCSLNCKFIIEYLENVNKNVVISATNHSSMFSIHEINNEDYIYLLMPLALRD